jgi:hypothetical protein
MYDALYIYPSPCLREIDRNIRKSFHCDYSCKAGVKQLMLLRHAFFRNHLK